MLLHVDEMDGVHLLLLLKEITKRSIVVGADLGNSERIDLFFIVMIDS